MKTETKIKTTSNPYTSVEITVVLKRGRGVQGEKVTLTIAPKSNQDAMNQYLRFSRAILDEANKTPKP